MKTDNTPDPQFVESILVGLTYWRERTAHIDDQVIGELDAERQNLHRIVRYGLVLPQTWQSAAAVILQSFNFVERRGYWREWIPVLEKAIARCDKEHIPVKFKLLNQLGQLYRFVLQWTPALAAHEEAETIAQQLGDEQKLAESYCHLSELYLRQRQYSKAEKYGLAALARFMKIDATERWIAITSSTLGELARFRGDLAQAEERFSQAISYWRILNEPVRIARVLNDLAVAFTTAAKFEQAEKCLKETILLLGPTPNELDKVMAQINFGLLHFRRENWIGAEAAFRKANSSYLQKSPHIFYRALVANNLGNVLLKQDRLEDAASYLQDAITLWRQADDKLELANTLGTLAETLVAQRRQEEAIALFEEAIDLLSEYPDDTWVQKLQQNFMAQQKAIRTGVKS